MKKLLMIIMALGLFGAMPVLAAEHEGMKMDSHENMMMYTDDGARQCALQAESIQQKIKRLDAEIAMGTKAHDVNEVKKLEQKLKEANDLLDQLNSN